MYRIMLATSGNYYVQRDGPFGWKMTGSFMRTKAGARALVADLKRGCCGGHVVEYL